MIGAATAYLGLVIAFIGLAAALYPIRKLRLTSRLRGALLLLTGVLVVAIAFALPALDVHVAERRARLDEFAPVYQFNELHSIRIAAAPERVYQAMRAVTANGVSATSRRYAARGCAWHARAKAAEVATTRRSNTGGVQVTLATRLREGDDELSHRARRCRFAVVY